MKSLKQQHSTHLFDGWFKWNLLCSKTTVISWNPECQKPLNVYTRFTSMPPICDGWFLTFEKFLTVGNSFRISKKAQVSQIITYLLAIVIFAMVLIFGYKAIVNIRQQTEQATYLNFQKSLEADIKSIYFDYLSVKKVSYSVRGYNKICFADLDAPIAPASPPDDPPKIVENSMDSKIKKNIFLVNDKIDSFYIEKVILTEDETPPNPNPLCIPIVNGKLNIILTGQGDSALVQKG